MQPFANDVHHPDAQDVGHEVLPEEALTQYHVTQPCVADIDKPGPLDELGEFVEEGYDEARPGYCAQLLIDEQEAQEAEQGHGPECISRLRG